MRRTAAVLPGSVVLLSSALVPRAAAAPAEIVAPNARAAAEVDSLGRLVRQKNVTDSIPSGKGVYCVIIDPDAGIDLSTALILATGYPATNVTTQRQPTQACDNRQDAVTVVTLVDGRPEYSGFTLAVL
ncbi:hypothetical protein [Kitasatospora griseola]|uniref:hypothetical protein n=1 Tax=Kitasatospora griseola TaxID=2064 RepID=UPI0037FC35E7